MRNLFAKFGARWGQILAFTGGAFCSFGVVFGGNDPLMTGSMLIAFAVLSGVLFATGLGLRALSIWRERTPSK